MTDNILMSNIEVRSRNQSCCGKAVSLLYSDCGSVNLSYPACKLHAPNYIVMCGLSGSTIFSTLYSKWHDLRKTVIENKTLLLIFSTNFV